MNDLPRWPDAPAPPRTSSAPRFFGGGRVAVLDSSEMRRWDEATIRGAGVPGRTLLESAGRAAAGVVARLFPSGRVVAAVGSGNNGGDALVALRTLSARGRSVTAVQVGRALPDRELLHGWEVETVELEGAERVFRDAGVILDGMLGTGASGPPRGAYAEAISRMNDSRRPVVALDGPSGVDLSTGAAPGESVRAEVTVTFGAPKRGLLLFPGRERAGRIVAVEIGLAPLEPGAPGALLVTPGWARGTLRPVPADAHKGTLGKVYLVAGRKGMAGAAVLAGKGALRAGAGMVTLVSPEANRVVFQGALPEALFVDRDPLPSRGAEGADAIVAGPAMGTDDAALEALQSIVQGGHAPLLLDADAITLLGRHPRVRDAIQRPLLLTPHPGEMARLLGRQTPEVTADPFAAAADAAARFDCVVLLKGAPSVVAAPGHPTLVSVVGHSGIATGGNGDVLSGVVGALLAFGMAPREASAVALFYAGRAAEIAGRGRGLVPTDVTEALPSALTEEPAPESALGLPEVLLDLPPAR